MIEKRYLQNIIVNDLKDKMVFIGGPKQVGKTTLAKQIGKNDYKEYIYMNWDYKEDRKLLLSGKYRGGSDLVIFDEIHKYSKCKNFIKGEFDKHNEDFNILVTGSARLNVYKKGGDSMMGRYYYYRLHPFSLSEVLGNLNNTKPFDKLKFKNNESKSLIYDLLKYGGFPEPFLSKDERKMRRFQSQRIDTTIKEDIRDLELVRDISNIQVLVELLPDKVGSLLSLNSLREDLEVSHRSVSNWMDILERFYYHYRIYPYANKYIKSIKKEPKMYLWDWVLVEDLSARFENLMASHILKFVHYMYDFEGYKTGLYFIRDNKGREVDFLVTVNKRPWFMVEVKLNDTDISKNLYYFQEKLKIPFSYQVVLDQNIDYLKDNVRVISADKFLTALV